MAIALNACGGSGGPSTPTAPSTAHAIMIHIVGQNGMASFDPNPVSAGGQVVVFKNYDWVVHRVMLAGGLDTGDIAPGATSGAVQMPATGTYYHCALHPAMIGSVSAATGAPPPPCEGSYCSNNALAPALALAR